VLLSCNSYSPEDFFSVGLGLDKVCEMPVSLLIVVKWAAGDQIRHVDRNAVCDLQEEGSRSRRVGKS
jgi:hypothetical protein